MHRGLYMHYVALHRDAYRGDSLTRMQRVVTLFNKTEFARLQEYAKRKKTSLYALAKKAIREYVEKHP